MSELNWITLTTAMLQTRIAAPVYTAYTSSLAQGSQADPVPQILDDLTSAIRTAIRTGSRSDLGVAGTIPRSLRDDACDVAKIRLLDRLSGVTSASNDPETKRLILKAWDEKLLKISEGKLRVETPETVGESSDTITWGGETAIDI